MKHQQHGLGGLQVLMVVATIAVTSLVAVPKYQAFANKAKITEALNLASESKRKISQSFMVNNTLPRNASEASAMMSTTVEKPEFVREMKISADDPGKKVTIKVFLNEGVVENESGGDQYLFLSGKTTPGGQYALEWDCGAENINFELLPESCQG